VERFTPTETGSSARVTLDKTGERIGDLGFRPLLTAHVEGIR
jgi:hypothetical protein